MPASPSDAPRACVHACGSVRCAGITACGLCCLLRREGGRVLCAPRLPAASCQMHSPLVALQNIRTSAAWFAAAPFAAHACHALARMAHESPAYMHDMQNRMTCPAAALAHYSTISMATTRRLPPLLFFLTIWAANCASISRIPCVSYSASSSACTLRAAGPWARQGGGKAAAKSAR